MLTSKDLRTKYLQFFESKGHLVHSSDSLVPDDPSLLYTSAGMVQFKPYFLGERVPPATRIATSQKCMRTDDIDEVGDAVHHTFFEMLGNFSFGDYFKREAITWAWEFLTEVLEINPDQLWTSVYLDDDEAYDIWINEVKFPVERIVRLGEDKNYWPANAPSKGPNGVCGPCNEIFLDVTPEKGLPEDPAWAIAHDSNRFVEIWNLVFTQFDRQEDGTLAGLPSKNIDTGMGLERTVAVLQGTATNYETDLFMPIIERINSLLPTHRSEFIKKSDQDPGSNRPIEIKLDYGTAPESDRSIRVVADHIRSAVFAIGDGVMPSNLGRGYVVRRLIRNAVVRARGLGLNKPFMASLVPTVVELMGEVYPEIADRQGYIEKVIASEEEKFRATLGSGLTRLGEMLNSGEKVIAGSAAFQLYDTYGFPVELTRDIAAAGGVSVDMDGFKVAMEEQRRRAKEASDFGSVMVTGGATALLELEKSVEATKFVGYGSLASDSTILAIIRGEELASAAHAGERVEIVLDTTPFYAETGGQVGDTGQIETECAVVCVTDTLKASHFALHVAEVTSGSINVGDKVHATVDNQRRLAIARNHTATHLLHAGLHKVLGEHALQKGSVVDADRLRFDFSHFQAVTPDELRAIEDEVNSMILADLEASTVETSVDEARKMGATALFGEKYGDVVRVVRMGDESIELCGGTHLHHTAQVGLFKLTSESSVGAGLRRVEAVTGQGAVRFVHELEDQLRDTANALGAAPAELVSAAERTAAAAREAGKEIDRLKSKSAAEAGGDLADSAQEAGGVKFVTSTVATVDVPTLQKLADTITDKLVSGVVVLAGVADGKVLFVGKVTSDLVPKGFSAGNMLREVAKVAGGGGGGKPEFAQAGGKDASKVDEALAKACELICAQAGE
jgi:alanyl-tRNA synthetase